MYIRAKARSLLLLSFAAELSYHLPWARSIPATTTSGIALLPVITVLLALLQERKLRNFATLDFIMTYPHRFVLLAQPRSPPRRNNTLCCNDRCGTWTGRCRLLLVV
ncbi:hypothetical protein EDC04DRAFT_2638926 [Pisolithus marmoratus]|nr:hypothetical protein EDC04DRAFT_2638926 [Pisolithus marmoratus]